MYDVVNVVVATSPSGHLYLKTEMDADTPDQLLFLPECRGGFKARFPRRRTFSTCATIPDPP